jgi:hypothetical protein
MIDEINEERLGGGDWRGGVGIFTDIYGQYQGGVGGNRLSVNIDKEMMVSVARFEWLVSASKGGDKIKEMEGSVEDRVQEVSVFESVTAMKTVRVVNKGDYIDLETLRGSVRSVHLERLTADTIDWNLIAQSIAGNPA